MTTLIPGPGGFVESKRFAERETAGPAQLVQRRLELKTMLLTRYIRQHGADPVTKRIVELEVERCGALKVIASLEPTTSGRVGPATIRTARDRDRASSATCAKRNAWGLNGGLNVLREPRPAQINPKSIPESFRESRWAARCARTTSTSSSATSRRV